MFIVSLQKLKLKLALSVHSSYLVIRKVLGLRGLYFVPAARVEGCSFFLIDVKSLQD